MYKRFIILSKNILLFPPITFCVMSGTCLNLNQSEDVKIKKIISNMTNG